MNPNHSGIANFTVSEFRAFKRAYNVLLRTGMHPDQAVDILVASMMQKKFQAQDDQLRKLHRA
jgi:hypothetical protein